MMKIIRNSYDYVSDYQDGIARVCLNGKVGAVDEIVEVIPIKYDFISDFEEGVAVVVLNSECGLIDTKGNIITPIKYDYIASFENNLASVILRKRYGIVDRKGKIVIPLKYNYISSFIEGRALVRLDGKCGIIDTEGNIVIPMGYDYISEFEDGVALVRQANKYGIIDLEGKLVIPIKYDYISSFKDDIAVIILNKKFGLINKLGDEVIEPKYAWIQFYDNVYITEGIDGKKGASSNEAKRVTIPKEYDFIPMFSSSTLAIICINSDEFVAIDKQGNQMPVKLDAGAIDSVVFNLVCLSQFDNDFLSHGDFVGYAIRHFGNFAEFSISDFGGLSGFGVLGGFSKRVGFELGDFGSSKASFGLDGWTSSDFFIIKPQNIESSGQGIFSRNKWGNRTSPTSVENYIKNELEVEGATKDYIW
jgi:hypothetical protein